MNRKQRRNKKFRNCTDSIATQPSCESPLEIVGTKDVGHPQSLSRESLDEIIDLCQEDVIEPELDFRIGNGQPCKRCCEQCELSELSWSKRIPGPSIFCRHVLGAKEFIAQTLSEKKRLFGA